MGFQKNITSADNKIESLTELHRSMAPVFSKATTALLRKAVARLAMAATLRCLWLKAGGRGVPALPAKVLVYLEDMQHVDPVIPNCANYAIFQSDALSHRV